MKKIIKWWMICVLVLLWPVTAGAADNGHELKVIFVHDTHSHLDSYSTVIDGESRDIGGFARMKTLIDEIRQKSASTLLIDGGDFSMGTLVQTIYAVDCAELRLLGEMGFDATTLGNHEFDYRSEGLADALTAAKNSNDPLPEMVLCNVDWKTMEAEGLTQEQQKLREAFDAYGVKDYQILEKDGVKIALLGVFGKDALSCAPTCVLKFRDPIEAVKETVQKVKKEEDPDMIVCLSHSGTSEEADKSEDELLAKAIPELDLILSGHTHTILEKPVVHGDTSIVSAGEYGKYLGSFSYVQKENGRWEIQEYELTMVEESIPADRDIQKIIDDFMKDVDEKYLKNYDCRRDDVIAENSVDFCSVQDLADKHEEGNLGNLIADAWRYTVNRLEGTDYQQVDAAVCPSGTVRETYAKGNLTIEDVFHSFSLGVGLDGQAGYPLVSVYLTGKELKTVAEMDATVSDFMNSARLYNSGLHFTFNPHRFLLNKVTDCYLTDLDGTRIEIQDDRLYHVVTDLYTGQMLGVATSISYGILTVVPKDARGNAYGNIEEAIIHDADGKEVKAWDAIVRYMKSFADTNGNGIGDVPSWYGESQQRKVVEDEMNPVSILKKPNKFLFIFLGVILLLLLLLILLIRGIARFLKKRKKKNR
ncbi:MAG: 5'-nucleotidase C-terminal domain-containing protein [Blautia sp.]|nr:5'-nucleotidase C-terminal domain-containing protein [Blautia sp.]